MDMNGNGFLSLAEFDRGVRDVLGLPDLFKQKKVQYLSIKKYLIITQIKEIVTYNFSKKIILLYSKLHIKRLLFDLKIVLSSIIISSKAYNQVPFVLFLM